MGKDFEDNFCDDVKEEIGKGKSKITINDEDNKIGTFDENAPKVIDNNKNEEEEEEDDCDPFAKKEDDDEDDDDDRD